eukprot:4644682-Amphidinium_carterae.1
MGTTRKRAAEAEADDSERTAREESTVRETETEGKHGRLRGPQCSGKAARLRNTKSSLMAAITVEEPEVQVEWNRPRAECFHDEYTGIELPREGVIHARHEEMAYMQHLGVWEYSTTEECFTATGRKPCGVRWVDSDKSLDPETPDLRSRLGGCPGDEGQQLDSSRRRH